MHASEEKKISRHTNFSESHSALRVDVLHIPNKVQHSLESYESESAKATGIEKQYHNMYTLDIGAVEGAKDLLN